MKVSETILVKARSYNDGYDVSPRGGVSQKELAAAIRATLDFLDELQKHNTNPGTFWMDYAARRITNPDEG